MNLPFKVLSLTILAFFITACGTVPPAGDKPKVAPPNNKEATVYLFNSPGGVKVELEKLIVNNKEGGLTRRGGYTWFYAPPGKLDISLNDPVLTAQKAAKISISAKAGQSYYLLHTIGGDPRIISTPGAGAGAVYVSQRTVLLEINKKMAERMMVDHDLFGNTL